MHVFSAVVIARCGQDIEICEVRKQKKIINCLNLKYQVMEPIIYNLYYKFCEHFLEIAVGGQARNPYLNYYDIYKIPNIFFGTSGNNRFF